MHYFGKIHLDQIDNGWAISGFDLGPEVSVISLRDSGHGSDGYIIDVSMGAVSRYLGLKPNHLVDYHRIHAPRESKHGPVTVTYSDGSRRRLVVNLAKLYSGAYVPLRVHQY